MSLQNVTDLAGKRVLVREDFNVPIKDGVISDDTPYKIELNSEKDWTPISDFSEAAWTATIEKYKRSTDELSEVMKSLEDSRLDENVPEQPFSFYTLLHGVIQHDIYHSGQIVLLKKMLRG